MSCGNVLVHSVWLRLWPDLQYHNLRDVLIEAQEFINDIHNPKV